jgi:hypothetical protein
MRSAMAKTLSAKDPNLLAGVSRLKRVQQVWGVLLIALGVFTELAATSNHPVAGLPFIAIGLFAFRWWEPALLATVAILMAFSMVPTINPRITILGPDPIQQLASLSTIETVALVVGKMLITFTAANQFWMYRFLYGTELATRDDPNMAIIPPMVQNRTNVLARWGRWTGIVGLVLALGGLLFLMVDPGAYLPRIFAEMGGSLGVVAVGLGLGAAFSPTDLRRVALTSVGAGLAAYFIAAIVLLRLPF